jgi:effector-binding domain-containing protein
MEVAVPVDAEVVSYPPAEDHVNFRTIAGHDLAAAVIYEGPFAGIVGPIQSLLRWVCLHDHTPVGPLRELHLSGPAHDGSPETEQVIELQFPIAPLQTG